MDCILEEYIMKKYRIWYNHRWYHTTAKSSAQAKRKIAQEIKARPYEHRTMAEIMKGMSVERD